jgi:hypothetical protein
MERRIHCDSVCLAVSGSEGDEAEKTGFYPDENSEMSHHHRTFPSKLYLVMVNDASFSPVDLTTRPAIQARGRMFIHRFIHALRGDIVCKFRTIQLLQQKSDAT